ncbi:SAM-dependent methyltransferase [Aliifodinibius salipaludis]|uniref:SAM-dependent methyltransferase n=1 Tax=Fodinibius salipaludis TaxID=2032627 RepID=A0A2A2G817_9BACT|nr:class I SAM-dependent methyltransferase [Aliifodinibius salipaludis]PAU92995.1 SAM-dependent methyltransferase [Aliifodinibius salipaludis]
MDWFEEWFDSPLYEKLYADRDEKEAERLIKFLEQTLLLEEYHSILDLGCGRGRHSHNLAKRGYEVTGIDLSPEAIKTAKEKADEQGLQNVQFEVRDMREPLPQKFDAIVNLFTTFGYFKTDKENASVFESVVKMLRDEGLFVLDYLNAEKVKENFVPEEEGEFQGIRYEIKRYIKNGAIHKDIAFAGDKLDKPRVYWERVKLYGLDWFEKEMDKRNLEIIDVNGDYQGGDFDPQTSPRLLIISRLSK